MVRNRLATGIAVVAVLLVAFGLLMGALNQTADPNATVDLSEKGALGPAHGIGSSTTTTEAPSTTTDRGTFTSGDGTKLPEGWPAEVKIPQGVDLTATSKAGLTMQVSAQVTGAPANIYYYVRDSLTRNGFQLQANSFTNTPEGGFGTLSGTNDRYNVSVYVGPDSESFSGNILTITVGDQD